MSRKIKKGFLSCAIVTIIAFTLMLGSTMAWYQDTAVLVNTYTFGNLSVDILNGSNLSVKEQTLKVLNFVDKDNQAYGAGQNLFEPGATFRLEDFCVANRGDVTLQYRVELDSSGAVLGDSSKPNLLDAMDITITTKSGQVLYAAKGSSVTGTYIGTLAPNTTTEPIVVKLHMREDAGNEYMNLSVSCLDVKVYAWQEGASWEDVKSELKPAE